MSSYFGIEEGLCGDVGALDRAFAAHYPDFEIVRRMRACPGFGLIFCLLYRAGMKAAASPFAAGGAPLRIVSSVFGFMRHVRFADGCV
jgi:hypothetical protein